MIFLVQFGINKHIFFKFLFSSPGLQILPYDLEKCGVIFFGKYKFHKTVRKSSSEVHLSYLTIALSRNDKINPKTEKVEVNWTSKMSYSIEAVI